MQPCSGRKQSPSARRLPTVIADVPVMTPDKKPVSPWLMAAINLLAWPGIGTFIGGQKVVGAIQAALALAGGLLSLCLIVVMFRLVIKLDSTSFDTGSFVEANGTLLGLGGGGLGLLAISWVWAAVSSLQIAIRLKTRD